MKASQLFSSTLYSISFEEMIDDADFIVIGYVERQTTSWWNKKNKIVTITEIHVLEELKNNTHFSYNKVRVLTLGGELKEEKIGLWVPGEVQLREGVKYLMFLKKRKDFFVPIAMGYSVFEVSQINNNEFIYLQKDLPRLSNQGKNFIKKFPIPLQKVRQLIYLKVNRSEE